MLRTIAAVLLTLALPAVALGADPITVPIDSTGRGVPLTEGATDWNGFYAGVYGVARYSESNGGQAGLGVEAMKVVHSRKG